jgi:hypothetical protein
MKLAPFALLLASLLFAAPVFADDAGKEEAAKLLDVLDMQATMDQAVVMSLETQLKSNPQLAPYRDVMLGFLRKHMSYEALKPELVELYAGEFTAAELKEARMFYSTSTGKKFISSMPRMMELGGAIGGKQVEQHLPELQALIEQEAARIEKAKPAATP